MLSYCWFKKKKKLAVSSCLSAEIWQSSGSWQKDCECFFSQFEEAAGTCSKRHWPASKQIYNRISHEMGIRAEDDLAAGGTRKGHHTGLGCWQVNKEPGPDVGRHGGSWPCEQGFSALLESTVCWGLCCCLVLEACVTVLQVKENDTDLHKTRKNSALTFLNS